MPIARLLLLMAGFVLLINPSFASPEPEKPMQVCTPLSTGPCATIPRPMGKPTVTLRGGSAGLAGLQGAPVAVLDVVVGTDGIPYDIEVIKPATDEMTGAAIESVKKWRFSTGLYEGRAVAVELRINLRFNATGEINIGWSAAQASWVDPEQVQKLFNETYQAYTRHDYQSAVGLGRQLIAMAPLTQRIRLTIGMSLLELNQFEDAEKVLHEEIKLDPKSAYAHNTFGMIYWRQHKYDDATAQFKEQIGVTPEGYDAHANLGVLLCARKKCSEAMPELDKALSLSPGQARPLLSRGECDIDFGNTAKGISEMEQAANESDSPVSWNQAAYRLSVRGVELDRAEKWAKTAITVESALLRSLSLDHVTPTQMRLVSALSNYWDTLGWIYFRKGEDDQARIYVDAAWRLHPTPTKGDHLGQIYEKLGKQDEAIRTYAMAIASADLATRGVADPDDLVEARERLVKMAGQEANVSELIRRGHADLEALASAVLDNPGKNRGSADFIMTIAGDKILDVRRVGGDAELASFSESLRRVPLPVWIPEEGGIEILRRGTLTCKSDSTGCHFVLLNAEETSELAMKEANSAKAR
jgi:tetratricopeptide (TPR) repeat protein